MKISGFLLVLFLAFSTSVNAMEAWLLEMDAKYSASLIEKYKAADKEPYRKALEMLPALIKSGKIQEIERIVMSNEGKAGIHFPRKATKQSEAGTEMELGSSYCITNENRVRMFGIITRERFPLSMSIAAAGDLPKEWMPTFIVEKGKTIRVLMEKDPKALVEFFEMKQELRFATAIPELLSTTWMITESLTKKIDAGDFEANDLFWFDDTEDFLHEERQEGRQLGPSIHWKLTSKKTLALEWTDTKLVSSERYVHLVHEAAGEIAKPGEALKADILFFRDGIENERYVKKDQQVKGQAEFSRK